MRFVIPFLLALCLTQPLRAQEGGLFPLDLPPWVAGVRAELAPLMAAGDWDAALPLQARIADAAEEAGGPLHLLAITERVGYLKLLDNTGQDAAALEGALALFAAVKARYLPYAVQYVDAATLAAELLAKAGRAAEALPIALEVARVTEGITGAGSAATAYMRFQAVQILDRMGYWEEAIPAYAGIITALLADGGRDARGLAAGVLVRKGRIHDEMGDLEAALADYRQAEAVVTEVKGPRHPETLATRRLLARLLFDMGDTAGTAAILQANLPVVLDIYGPDGVETADWRRMQALWEDVAGKGAAEAERLLRASLAAMEARLPSDHRLILEARRDLAVLVGRGGRWVESHHLYRAAEDGGQTDRKFAFDVLGFALEAGSIDAAAMAEAALPTLQRAAFGRARGAVDEQTKRLLLSSDAARGVYRRASDLRERRGVVAAEMSELATRPVAEADRAREAALKAELADLTAGIDAAMAQVHALEPGFAEITGDLELTVAEIQGYLKPDEVFVLIDHQRHDQEWSMVVAITPDRAVARNFWVPVADLQGWVSEVRASLGLKLGLRGAAALDGDTVPAVFPYDAAWRLYQNSFLQVSELVDGKRHVYVDLRGPLTGLPPALLLAYPPEPDITLQNAPFIARYHAVTVLPSVSGLRSAALARERPRAPQAFAGFANPEYDAAAVEAALLADAGAEGESRLRSALVPLPETAGEVADVAQAVAPGGGAAVQVWQGLGATEAAAKSGALSDFRMIYFATHGLVAGDRAGGTLLSEAALALTPGAGEDGFLTSTEIAQLDLNADWVVLSACNTAQGDTPGAEALSGLAQAFLYSGARALLVSHWPVESRSAVALMTDLFRIRAANPDWPAAEAHQQAMVNMILNPDRPDWAHPAFWAPFVLVGSPD